MQESNHHHNHPNNNNKIQAVDSAPQRVFRQPSHPSVYGGGSSIGTRSIGAASGRRRPNRFANFSYDSSCASSSNNKRKNLANLRSWHSGTKLLKSSSSQQQQSDTNNTSCCGEGDITNLKNVNLDTNNDNAAADEKPCTNINANEEGEAAAADHCYWDEKNDTKRKSLTMQQLMMSVGSSFRGGGGGNTSRRTSGNSSLMSSLSTAFSFNSMRSIIMFSTEDLEDDDELNLPTCIERITEDDNPNHHQPNNSNDPTSHHCAPINIVSLSSSSQDVTGKNVTGADGDGGKHYPSSHISEEEEEDDDDDDQEEQNSDSSSCQKKKKPPKFPWRQISWRSGLSGASLSNNNKTKSSSSSKDKKKKKTKKTKTKKSIDGGDDDDTSPQQQSIGKCSSTTDKQQQRVFQFLLSNRQRQSFNMKNATIQEEDHPHDASATLRMSASSDYTFWNPEMSSTSHYGTGGGAFCCSSSSDPTPMMSSSASLRLSGRSEGGGSDHELPFPVRRESYSSHYSCNSATKKGNTTSATTNTNTTTNKASLPVNATTLEKKSFLKRQLQFPKQRLGQVLRRVTTSKARPHTI